MNAAGFLCGISLDLFRVVLREGFRIPGRAPGFMLNDGNRLLLLCGEAADLACVCVWQGLPHHT